MGGTTSVCHPANRMRIANVRCRGRAPLYPSLARVVRVVVVTEWRPTRVIASWECGWCICVYYTFECNLTKVYDSEGKHVSTIWVFAMDLVVNGSPKQLFRLYDCCLLFVFLGTACTKCRTKLNICWTTDSLYWITIELIIISDNWWVCYPRLE